MAEPGVDRGTSRRTRNNNRTFEIDYRIRQQEGADLQLFDDQQSKSKVSAQKSDRRMLYSVDQTGNEDI